jgi:hypothetical protein
MFNSAEFIASPYPTYQTLRSTASIHYFNAAEGAWLLPRFDDVVDALYNPRLSARRSHIIVDRLPLAHRDKFTEFKRIMARWMAFLDPPEHSALRKILNQAFKPQALQALRPRIQQLADSLLDKVQPLGRMEFMRDFAYPFPVLVIAEMLGVDPSDQPKFIAWSDDIVRFMGPTPSLEIAHRAQQSLLAITSYFDELLPKRRQKPGDDLISLLIQLQSQDKALTTKKLLAQCSMLLVTGHEAPRSMLGNGLLTLLQHPAQLERLKKDPVLMPNAVREMVRYEGPVQFITRPVIEDFCLYGQQIKQDQFVYALVGAANRDDNKFTEADTFDITRQEGNHLGFGSGVHFCLGANLAYIEAEIAFKTILDRMPNIKLALDSPDWNGAVALRTLNSLPLVF